MYKKFPKNASRDPAVYRKMAEDNRDVSDWKTHVKEFGDPGGNIAKLIKAKFDFAVLCDKIADVLEEKK